MSSPALCGLNLQHWGFLSVNSSALEYCGKGTTSYICCRPSERATVTVRRTIASYAAALRNSRSVRNRCCSKQYPDNSSIGRDAARATAHPNRSEEHTSE